jgi:hypothetical protein
MRHLKALALAVTVAGFFASCALLGYHFQKEPPVISSHMVADAANETLRDYLAQVPDAVRGSTVLYPKKCPKGKHLYASETDPSGDCLVEHDQPIGTVRNFDAGATKPMPIDMIDGQLFWAGSGIEGPCTLQPGGHAIAIRVAAFQWVITGDYRLSCQRRDTPPELRSYIDILRSSNNNMTPAASTNRLPPLPKCEPCVDAEHLTRREWIPYHSGIGAPIWQIASLHGKVCPTGRWCSVTIQNTCWLSSPDPKASCPPVIGP